MVAKAASNASQGRWQGSEKSNEVHSCRQLRACASETSLNSSLELRISSESGRKPRLGHLWEDTLSSQKQRARRLLELRVFTPYIGGASCGHLEMAIVAATDVEHNSVNQHCGLEPFAIILNVFVNPQRRNQCIGAALCEDALHYATERGVSRVVLQVQDSNTGARRFYKRICFQETGITVQNMGKLFHLVEYAGVRPDVRRCELPAVKEPSVVSPQASVSGPSRMPRPDKKASGSKIEGQEVCRKEVPKAILGAIYKQAFDADHAGIAQNAASHGIKAKQSHMQDLGAQSSEKASVRPSSSQSSLSTTTSVRPSSSVSSLATSSTSRSANASIEEEDHAANNDEESQPRIMGAGGATALRSRIRRANLQQAGMMALRLSRLRRMRSSLALL